ncbi:4'-phosphopantetheinyl transferase family protein [Rothia nasimurium]|uniref:4'-phosphopantetheinyl transferase family protein n=1 Tax=Rothia nasimurium TaxID=85336 RepID=UPI001F00F5EB|nr:4'-phosphopantetheinyl transferase superfamily protein [Rothia nasimurium]
MVHPSATAEAASAQLTLFCMPAETLRTGHGVSWLAYVGLAEQARAAEFKNPDEALAFAAQHTLMRCMAASHLGVKATSASEIPVDRTCLLCVSSQPHGKPRIEGVNLSMARALGLAAGVTGPAGLSIGLDLITVRGSYYDSFDRIALADYEKRVVASLPTAEAALARHLLWSAKEAVLKATGYGLALAPSTVMLALPPLPAALEDAHGLTARASVQLPGEAQPRTYWVTWQVHEGTYLLAIASDQPHALTSHRVTAPLMVRRALEQEMH